MNNTKYILFFLLLYFGSVIIAYFVGYENNKIQTTIIKTDTKIDTIYKTIEKNYVITKKGKIQYDTAKIITIIKDSIQLEVLPFYSMIDTVINHDTIQAKYTYPENRFDIGLRTKIDSVQIITNTLYKDKKVNWYEKPLFIFVSSFVSGLLISRVVK